MLEDTFDLKLLLNQSDRKLNLKFKLDNTMLKAKSYRYEGDSLIIGLDLANGNDVGVELSCSYNKITSEFQNLLKLLRVEKDRERPMIALNQN